MVQVFWLLMKLLLKLWLWFSSDIILSNVSHSSSCWILSEIKCSSLWFSTTSNNKTLIDLSSTCGIESFTILLFFSFSLSADCCLFSIYCYSIYIYIYINKKKNELYCNRNKNINKNKNKNKL